MLDKKIEKIIEEKISVSSLWRYIITNCGDLFIDVTICGLSFREREDGGFVGEFVVSKGYNKYSDEQKEELINFLNKLKEYAR